MSYLKLSAESPRSNVARVLCYDLEVTALEADLGWMVCFGYGWLAEHKAGMPAKVLTSYRPDDKKLVTKALKIYESADIVVGYNSHQFDRPYLFAKAIEHGLVIPSNVPSVDLYQVARSNLALSRKSLANVSDFAHTNSSKLYMDRAQWKLVKAWHRPTIDILVEHCRADVATTLDLYLKMRPLIRLHPRVGTPVQCRHCGSDHLVRRGFALPVAGQLYRKLKLQCQSCGAYQTRAMTPEERATQGGS